MFKGIVEEVAQIVDIKRINDGIIFSVSSNFDFSEIKIGDSISINGACQTVIKKEQNLLTFEAMKETLNVTNFNTFKTGTFVNLERAMRLSDRIDGHLVSGHIDTVSPVISIYNLGEAKVFRIKSNSNLIIKKGSVSLNGISLTVSEKTQDYFEVSILPFTFMNTNLKYLKQNDLVNIEYDMIGKYLEQFAKTKTESKITKEFLIENGF